MALVPKEELPEFVRNIRSILKLLPPSKRATIIALRGGLGSGKTTFVQELARDFGVHGPIQSPTYVLMKSYPLPDNRTGAGLKRRFKKIVHIDAYRLNDPQEFSVLKPEEFLSDPEALVLVEWPENLAGVLPEPDVTLTFSADGASPQERYIGVA
jgi:tRNA threonylcarbamoyladenosine biosynthesis protein TsaE